MYKSQLQEYAQKAGLLPPTYDHVKEGASHEPRFKSTVYVNSQSYSSAPGYPNLRSAEHAAAKAALDVLQNSQTSGVVPSPVHESGLCKNLLQEFAQKNGYPLPQYKITRQGEDHSPTFTSTVEIAGVSYSGGAAKNKKEAEIKAARTAFLAIQATQPAWGVPALEPSLPPPQPQAGQIAAFTKNHPKRKKRGRAHQQVAEEPVATRMKVPGDQAAQGLQVPQLNQVLQIIQFPQASQGLHFQPQGPPMAHVAHLPPNGSYGHVGVIGQVPTPLVDTNVHFSEPVSATQSMQNTDVVMTEKDQISAVKKETLSEAQGTHNTTPVVNPQMVTPRPNVTTIIAKPDAEAQEVLLNVPSAPGQQVPAVWGIASKMEGVQEVIIAVNEETSIVNPQMVTLRPNVTTIIVKPDPEAQAVLLNVPSASGQQVPAVSGIAPKMEGIQEVKIVVNEETSIAEIIPQPGAVTTEVGLPTDVANVSAPPISTLSIDQVQDADGKVTGVLSAFQVDRESVLIPGITPAPQEPVISQNPTNQVDDVPLANGELHADNLKAVSQG